MRKTGTGSGGGTGMNKNVSPKVRTGPNSTEKISPCAVNQLGTKLGNPQAIEKIVQGTMPQVPLGNTLAPKVTQGPGGSRTVQKSGSQAQHGPAAGSPRGCRRASRTIRRTPGC